MTTTPTIAEQLVAEFSGQSNAVLADAIHERYEGQYESNEESSPFSPMILTFADRSTLSIVGWDLEPDEDADPAERQATDDTPTLTAGMADDETDE